MTTPQAPNAALISAAPEMYEALNLIFKRLAELNRDDDAGMRLVIANALSKARGETP